jgi:site-specific DNA-methyltransferase (adenine-specific)
MTAMSNVRAVHGDAIRLLPRYGPYDFIFADPPFNLGQDYHEYADSIGPGDYKVFTLRWVTACRESISDGGVIALHGNDALVELYLVLIAGMRRIAWVNWHYRFGQCTRSNWIDARCHCLIYAGGNGAWTWNPDDVLVESDRATTYADARVSDYERGGKRLPGTVWGVPSDGPFWGRIQGNNAERRKEHPNQLPEVYLERLIRAYTNAGDLVCDPFGGSGTTAVVCKALGRDCITFDVSKRCIKSIKDRLASIGAVRTGKPRR